MDEKNGSKYGFLGGKRVVGITYTPKKGRQGLYRVNIYIYTYLDLPKGAGHG